MESRLEGLAISWYNGLYSYGLTWPEWKKLIVTILPTHYDYSNQLRKMLRRIKLSTGAYDKYYF